MSVPRPLLRSRAARASSLAVAAVALGLSACTTPMTLDTGPPTTMSAWTEPLAPGAEAVRDDWWRALGSPTLDHLVVAAAAHSPDLQNAAVKVLQTEAQARVTRAGLLPGYGAGASLSAYRIPPELADQLRDAPPEINLDKLSAQASWEPDFWQARTHQLRSDKTSAAAAQAAYEAGMASLIAQVASGYVNLALLEQRLKLAELTAALQRDLARLAQSRYAEGESSGQDPAQARVSANQAGAQVANLQSQAALQRHALALLVGVPDDTLLAWLSGAELVLPATPAPLAPGLPRDLLRNRPDVFEAELQVRAQFEKLKSVKASLYPSLSLTGSLGFSASDVGASSLGDLFNWEKRALQFTASLSAPIFEHGKLVNEVRLQDAALEQAIQAYRKAVLSAQRDVQDALAQDLSARAQSAAQAAAAQASARDLALTEIRRREGEIDRASALSARVADVSVQDQRLQAEAASLQAYISVNRALGLGWRGGGGSEGLAPDVRKRMTDRTRWGDLLPAKPPSSRQEKTSP